jgi:hypothetical protein
MSVLKGKHLLEIEGIKLSMEKILAFLLRILKTVSNSGRNAGNVLKNWRESTFKNKFLKNYSSNLFSGPCKCYRWSSTRLGHTITCHGVISDN